MRSGTAERMPETAYSTAQKNNTRRRPKRSLNEARGHGAQHAADDRGRGGQADQERIRFRIELEMLLQERVGPVDHGGVVAEEKAADPGHALATTKRNEPGSRL